MSQRVRPTAIERFADHDYRAMLVIEQPDGRAIALSYPHLNNITLEEENEAVIHLDFGDRKVTLKGQSLDSVFLDLARQRVFHIRVIDSLAAQLHRLPAVTSASIEPTPTE